MAKYGKYRSQQELIEAKQGGIMILETLNDVIKEVQEVRRDFDKPGSKDYLNNTLRNWLICLNKIVKQLKRNKKLN